MPRPYQAARRGSSSSSSETGDHEAPPSMHESLRSETGAFSEDEEEREDSEQHENSPPVRTSISNKNAEARQDGSEDEEEGERLLRNPAEQQRSRSTEQERAARYGAAAQGSEIGQEQSQKEKTFI